MSARSASACPAVIAAAALTCGCTVEEPIDDTPAAAGCLAPGLVMPDGSCMRPGVPLDGCAPGFTHDAEYGCQPVLPAMACPPGLIAIPGDAACRPLAACGSGTWGAIPVEPGTVYVDASYTAADGDGSAGKPFKTIAAALGAVADNGVVAIAAGSYAENVVIQQKRVRLWGVCPEKVEIAPPPVGASNKCTDAAVCVLSGGAELHMLALRGGAFGLGAPLGLPNGVVDRVWLHDATGPGMLILPVLSANALTITGSLIEHNRTFGVYLYGVKATIDKSAVRNTQARADKRGGDGLYLVPCGVDQGCTQDVPGDVTITASVFEGNLEAAISDYGSMLRVDGSVVQNTQPRAFDSEGGFGILEIPCKSTEGCKTSLPGTMVVARSWFRGNHTAAIAIEGSKAEITTTVVRDTLPRADGRYGGGVQAEGCYPAGGCPKTLAPELTLTRSLVDGNRYVGVALIGATATIADSAIRNTQPEDAGKAFGRGVAVASCKGPSCASNATISGTLVSHSYEFGVEVSDSNATLSRSAIFDTLAGAEKGGGFGDGLSAAYLLQSTATVTLEGTRIERAARAALSAFGATAAIGTSRFSCSGFALDGEANGGFAFKFDDRGGNLCGCPADGACKVVSAQLAPPNAPDLP